MLLAVCSAVLVFGTGFVVVRGLSLGCGWLGATSAIPLGLATCAVLAVWAQHLGWPEPLVGLALCALAMAGLGLAVRQWLTVWRRRSRRERLPIAPAILLGAALGASLVTVAAGAPINQGVPAYAHDGAHHVELVDALRHGSQLSGFGWYPTGFHAPAAALLSLLPGVDSATGAIDAASALTLLAPLALFAFAIATLGNPLAAGAAALALALTSAFPYGVHLYSVWPMAAGLILVLGLWTSAVSFFERPRAELALAGGLLAGAIVLTHGTEVYTATVGLLALAAARWRRIWAPATFRHLATAVGLAAVVVGPYWFALVGWAGGGGAVGIGVDYFVFRHSALPLSPLDEAIFWAGAVSSGYLVDVPLRVALIAAGAITGIRHGSARWLIAPLLVFAALVSVFRYVDVPLVQWLFALSLPWGVDDRLIMSVSIVAAVLTGQGLVSTATWFERQSTPRMLTARALAWQRRARLAVVFGTAVACATLFMVAVKFETQTNALVTYSAEDAMAMTWLRQHVATGDVLMNDGAADAGIWAPYKGNVPITMPRTRRSAPGSPELLLRDGLAELDGRPDLRVAACALHLRYVYRGSAPGVEDRHFPDPEQLRSEAALEEVFRSGRASVLRTRIPCP